MASTKHLKIKNTGILFELLTRQITADVLNGKENSVAIKTMKGFFSENTELGKELELYNVLMNEKFTTEKQAEKLIEAVTKSRQRLSNKKLKLEKYNLIKTIKESYDIVNFFSSRIPNYKVFASVYKLFEYNTNQHRNNPTDEIRNKYSIVEHIISKKVDSSVKTNKIIETYKKSEKDLRRRSHLQPFLSSIQISHPLLVFYISLHYHSILQQLLGEEEVLAHLEYRVVFQLHPNQAVN